MSVLKKINGLLLENLNESSQFEQDIMKRVERTNRLIDKGDSLSKDILSFYKELKLALGKDLLDGNKLSYDKLVKSDISSVDIESPYGVAFKMDSFTVSDYPNLNSKLLEIQVSVDDRNMSLAVSVLKRDMKNYYYPINQ